VRPIQRAAAVVFGAGFPCVFGEAQVRLLDEFDQLSRYLRVVAKFVTQPLPRAWEGVALLGYSFLLDNSLPMDLNPRNRRNAGNINNIVGHLTVP
jgi:hypothetical protein